MKLYYLRGACSLADHIVLEWIGAPYEAIRVQRETLHEPEFLRLNPLGAVPALVVGDGPALTQNAAILNYLADTYPQAELGGDGSALGRAEVNRWLALCNTDIHPWFKPLFAPQRFVDGDDARQSLQRNALVQLRRLFEVVDQHLTGRDWLAERRSIADPYLYVLLRWAKAMQLPQVHVDLDGLAQLERFFARMQADAGVRAALAQEGLE